MHWRAGTVTGETHTQPGAVRCRVLLDDGTEAAALSYLDTTGPVGAGDRVLLNCSALHRGLGTGGLAFVVALLDRLPPDPPLCPGHIVKARYTPLQQMVLSADEPDSPHHEALVEADDLAGMPVVAADLHSALPAVLAGVRAERPEARVAYVMTDGGALPAAFSSTVAGLLEAGWLAEVVTVGQAYGGTLEAVSVHSGLLTARHAAAADLAVVAQGPGNAGTGTRWGFSGVAVAEALHAASVLGGRPIGLLRVSGADARDRHHGVSHHTLTTLGRALLAPADVPWCPTSDAALDARIAAQLAGLVESARAALSPVEVDSTGLGDLLQKCPVRLSTMGRGLDADPAPFLIAAAAGRHAASALG